MSTCSSGARNSVNWGKAIVLKYPVNEQVKKLANRAKLCRTMKTPEMQAGLCEMKNWPLKVRPQTKQVTNKIVQTAETRMISTKELELMNSISSQASAVPIENPKGVPKTQTKKLKEKIAQNRMQKSKSIKVVAKAKKMVDSEVFSHIVSTASMYGPMPSISRTILKAKKNVGPQVKRGGNETSQSAAVMGKQKIVRKKQIVATDKRRSLDK